VKLIFSTFSTQSLETYKFTEKFGDLDFILLQDHQIMSPVPELVQKTTQLHEHDYIHP